MRAHSTIGANAGGLICGLHFAQVRDAAQLPPEGYDIRPLAGYDIGPLGGYDIEAVQERIRHKDVQTTMIHTRVLNRAGRRELSPLDRL